MRRLRREIEDLRKRLRENDEALRAIRRGDVDALLVEGPEGPRAYTQDTADQPYRVLVEQMRDAALIVGQEGIVLYCNGRLPEMLGMAESQIVGRPLSEMVAAGKGDTLADLLARGREEAVARELRLRPEGVEEGRNEAVSVRITVSPLETDDLCGTSVVVTDLTQVKRRERIESQERLTRAVMEHAGTAILVLDEGGRITRMNRLAVSLLGSEARGALLHLLLPLPGTLEELSGAGIHEVALDGRDGRRSLLVGIRTPAETLPLDTARWIVTLVDITERREAEERLRFQAQVLDTVGEAVVATDLDGCVTYWNAQAERLFGWKAEEVLEKPLLEYTPSPASRADLERIMKTLRRGQTFSGEFELRRRDGTTFPAMVTDSPVYDRDDRVVGAVGISRDLTELKAMEQELRQSQKLKAIGQLAGGVAHDFNNILTAIRGHVELLLEDCRADEATCRDLTEIAANADRAAELTNQLLAFSRQQVLRPQLLDLGEVVERTRGLLRRLIGEHIEFVVSTGAEVGSVEADPHQLELVLMNLALNACDAMPNGGCLTIELDDVQVEAGRDGAIEVRPGRYARIVVTDTGTGIADEVLERMYEPFFTTKEKGKGTGLGLSTVYGIVKQSGGFIFAESELGRGSTFEVLLPRVEGDP